MTSGYMKLTGFGAYVRKGRNSGANSDPNIMVYSNYM